MSKFIVLLEHSVDTEKLNRMVYTNDLLCGAFGRMIESEEIKGYLNEYLKAIVEEANEQGIEITPAMEAKFDKEIREILMLGIYESAVQILIEKIAEKGIIFPVEVPKEMHRIIADDSENEDGKYAGIIKKYLEPLNDNSKKKPSKTPIQKMLKVISSK